MKETWQGCDDDCFNCEYSDCLKPANKCKSTPYNEKKRGNKIDKLLQRDRELGLALDEALRELRV